MNTLDAILNSDLYNDDFIDDVIKRQYDDDDNNTNELLTDEYKHQLHYD